MVHLTILACLATSIAMGLAQEQQCSSLSCAATPSRSLLQAQAARKIDETDDDGGSHGPNYWADEAYQVAECGRQKAYDQVMAMDETFRHAAFETFKKHYAEMGLTKWADDAQATIHGILAQGLKATIHGQTHSRKAETDTWVCWLRLITSENSKEQIAMFREGDEQFVFAGALLVLALGLLFVHWYRPLLVKFAIWLGSSIAMNLVNKKSVGIFPPFTLVVVQMGIVIFILLMIYGILNVAAELQEKGSMALRWVLIAMPFTGMLATSMIALDWGTVTMLLVGRNLLPLLMLFLERALLPESGINISIEVVLSLATVTAGTMAYAGTDLTSFLPQMLMIMLNIVLSCMHRIMERRLLIDPAFKLSFGTSALLNNVLGIGPMLILAVLRKEHLLWGLSLQKLLEQDGAMSNVAVSGFIGCSLGYYSIAAQKAVPATTFLVFMTGSKVVTILLTMIFLHDTFTIWSSTACAVSLGASVWYTEAAKRAKGPLVGPVPVPAQQIPPLQDSEDEEASLVASKEGEEDTQNVSSL